VSDGHRRNHWHVAMEDKEHDYHSITDGELTKAYNDNRYLDSVY